MSRIHGTASSIAEVTPSDATIVDCDMIYVEVAGDLSIVTPKGQTVTIAVAATSYHLFEASKIRSTGTTATGIFALHFE